MLTIFLVNPGHLVQLDIKHAMGDVFQLQLALADEVRISVENQVLLTSQGLVLDSDAKVASYNTGTETSPLFLYDKSAIELASGDSLVLSSRIESDGNLLSRLNATKKMRSCQETLRERIQLAQMIYRESAKLSKACADLLRDQRMQKMGWDAALANLEKTGILFGQRMSTFCAKFRKFLEMKSDYVEEIDKFQFTIDLLRKIPLPASLIGSTENENFEEEELENSSTLLDWISKHDTKCSIENLSLICKSALSHVTEETLKETMKQAELITGMLDNPAMKEVSGLNERFEQLELQLKQILIVEREQSDIAQGWRKNGERAAALRDLSILPDLCAAHEAQLPGLAENYQRLRQSKLRFGNAKKELSINLHKRMHWLMAMQKKICECDSHVVLQLENVKISKQRIDVVMEINRTPILYLKSVEEVIRQKQFNEQFLKWASGVSGVASKARTNEVKRREDFRDKLGKHFIRTLFVGISDLPSRFAIDLPRFCGADVRLINQSYFDHLKDLMPLESNHLFDVSSLALYYPDSGVLESVDELSLKQQVSLLQAENREKDRLIVEQRKQFENRLMEMEAKVQNQAKFESCEKIQMIASQSKAEVDEVKLKMGNLEKILAQKDDEILKIRIQSEEKIKAMTSEMTSKLEQLENTLAEKNDEISRIEEDHVTASTKLLEKEKSILEESQSEISRLKEQIFFMEKEEKSRDEKLISLEGKLSDALVDLEDAKQDKERVVTSLIQKSEIIDDVVRDGATPPSVDDDVVKKLMESERDMKEMKRSVDLAEKAKELFEERLLRREQEMEIKHQELEKHVDEMLKILALNGVSYSLPRATTGKPRPKLALIDFRVGDLALFVFRGDAYVAYTIGGVLYFLHPDSFEKLGIGTGAEKTAQILGYVTEREYCQCKKKNNRFKLPVGTRFYRLKARGFDMDQDTKGSDKPLGASGTSPYRSQ